VPAPEPIVTIDMNSNIINNDVSPAPFTPTYDYINPDVVKQYQNELDAFKGC